MRRSAGAVIAVCSVFRSITKCYTSIVEFTAVKLFLKCSEVIVNTAIIKEKLLRPTKRSAATRNIAQPGFH